jgi:sulfoxide reductase catalytic subunit YedY
MPQKFKPDLIESDITAESIYRARRNFIRAGSSLALGLLAGCAKAENPAASSKTQVIASTGNGYVTNEALTPYADVTSYNNFYEFGTDKSDPKRYAKSLVTQPWSVVIEGECDKPGNYALEDILQSQVIEDRIYRLRCVEAWSMVIPWQGFPLAELIKRAKPNSRAKYVAFETLHKPEQMRGQRSAFGVIDWPYVEGLRMDEAMHPLTLLATGLYGKPLPNQNGAPLRLVVPWKYGFKSIKSIVKIRFTEAMPPTSWNQLAPHEYGFYSNVNPAVNHPRWSQASERRLPASLLTPRRIDTLLFNGYAEQVASLYSGMNLKRFF